MPRKPSVSHPLRQIREAVGKTQPEFAQMVGCSTPTIRGIENGQRRVTQELAERIMDETGAWPFCLSENWQEAFDLRGEPYTAVSYLRFKEGLDEESAAASKKRVFNGLVHVFDAAEKLGKSHLVLYHLSKAVAEIFGRLGLEDSLFRVYEEISIQIGPQYTARQLRDDPNLAKTLGIKVDPNWPDEYVHYVKVTPEHATNRSPHRSRWDFMDIEAPWFIAQGFGRDGLSDEERKIYGAGNVRIQYQNRQGARYTARMVAEAAESQDTL